MMRVAAAAAQTMFAKLRRMWPMISHFFLYDGVRDISSGICRSDDGRAALRNDPEFRPVYQGRLTQIGL
jgi:hypothetical protein